MSMNIKDKLFISEYENTILKGILFQNQLERWVPGCSHSDTEKEHLLRYNWVSKYTKNKVVMDIACGTGKGSYILATRGKAKRIIACDIDIKSLRYASIKYANPVISHRIFNAEDIEWRKKSIDVIVCLETIEHLNKPERFLNKAKDLLSDGGIVIISTPISKVGHTTHSNNKYHNQEWDLHGFNEFIRPHFEIVQVYIQTSKSQETVVDKIFRILKRSNLNTDTHRIIKSNKHKGRGDYQILILKKYDD